MYPFSHFYSMIVGCGESPEGRFSEHHHVWWHWYDFRACSVEGRLGGEPEIILRRGCSGWTVTLSQLLVRDFYSFIHSFIHLFIHLSIHSSGRTVTLPQLPVRGLYSFIHFFLHSLIHSYICTFSNPFFCILVPTHPIRTWKFSNICTHPH